MPKNMPKNTQKHIPKGAKKRQVFSKDTRGIF
jgi:hypothetical protein